MDPSITEWEWRSRIYNIDLEVQKKLAELFDRPYKYAKLGVFYLESSSRKLNATYMLRFIEATDYIRKALVECAGDKKRQLKYLNRAEKILKRISTETIETYVNQLHSSLLNVLQKSPAYYQLTFSSLPDETKTETYLTDVQYHLDRGKELKQREEDWEYCMEEFEKAYEEIEILKNLLPESNESKYRFYAILVPIITFMIGVLITIILHYW